MRNLCCEFVKRSGKVSNEQSNKESALAIGEAFWSGFHKGLNNVFAF